MKKKSINLFYFGLVSMMYYISYRMYQTDTVEMGLNYKYQFTVINWAYVFLIATTFAIIGLYLSGLNEFIPFLRSKSEKGKPEKSIRLNRTERRAKARQQARK